MSVGAGDEVTVQEIPGVNPTFYTALLAALRNALK